MTIFQNVRDLNPDLKTVQFRGNGTDAYSWRVISPETSDPAGTLELQRKGALTETDIALTDAKWVAIRDSGLYTPTNQYFASVLTDTRTNKNTPSGITGDQVGVIIGFDGTWWISTPTEWVIRDKASGTSNLPTFPFQVRELGKDIDRILFAVEREIPAANGFAREQVRFTADLSLIRWERDWVGEGRVVQTLEEEDYPTPVGGFIPVVRFRHYKNSNNVTVINPFTAPDNGPISWSSEHENNNDLRCQIGTQTLITGSDSPGLIVRNLAYEDRDGGLATFIDLRQVSSEQFSKVIFENVTIIGFADNGTLDGFRSIEFNSCRFALFSKGLTIKNFGSLRMINNEFFGLLEGGAVDLTIDGANGNAVITNTIWSQDDNAIAMDVKATSTINQGIVTNSAYAVPTGGQFFAPGSKDTTDVGWDYQNNGALRNSNAIADFSASGNVAPTVIPAIDTAVQINIAGIIGADERFIVGLDGTITYIGQRPENCQALLSSEVKVTPELEGAQANVTTHIYHNNDPIRSEKHLIASVFGTPAPIKYDLYASILLVFGDTIRGFTENTVLLNPIHETLQLSVRK